MGSSIAGTNSLLCKETATRMSFDLRQGLSAMHPCGMIKLLHLQCELVARASIVCDCRLLARLIPPT